MYYLIGLKMYFVSWAHGFLPGNWHILIYSCNILGQLFVAKICGSCVLSLQTGTSGSSSDNCHDAEVDPSHRSKNTAGMP